MKIISFFSILILNLLISNQLFSQESTHYYVIQLATYNSWEDFAKDEQKFYANTGTADNNIYGEQVGNSIKVYLLDSQEGSAVFFYDFERTQEVLSVVRSNPNWKGAFRKGNVNWENLIYYGEVFDQYKDAIPEEFSEKGDRIEVEYSPAATAQKEYKIQLGVFKEEKSKDFIINTFGFSEQDAAAYNEIVTYDFVKVGKTICRRYYVGGFPSKKTAEPLKKDIEKKSNRKLMIVQR